MPGNNSPRRKLLYRDAARAALIGLAVNLVLGVVKLTAGLVGHSFALLSDAVNSFGDVAASGVVLVGLSVAQRPPDHEHPYGHTRAEAVAGAAVAVLIVVTALGIGWEAVVRFPLLHALPPVWTLWIAGANVAIKETLYRYKVAVGRRTKSSAVIANAWDHRSDALCSLAVLIGLMIVKWGGPAWIWADEAAALVVAGGILWSGTQLFRNSASELMDVQADNETVAAVRAAALDVSGVHDVETLLVRKSGLEYFVDIHIEVAPHLTVSAGHDISHAVKDRLFESFAMIRNAQVHIEPAGHHALRQSADA